MSPPPLCARQMKLRPFPVSPGAALFAALSTGTLVWVMTAVHEASLRPATRSPADHQTPHNARMPFANPPSQPGEAETYSSHLPQTLREITRLDPRGSAAEDRAVVWQFLRQIKPGSDDLEWLIGADEALSWLRGASQVDAEIEGGLASLMTDTATPFALREYAAEHLGVWAEEHPQGMVAPDALRHAAAENPTSRLSGIALAALIRWPSSNKDQNWIVGTALAIASNTDAHPFSQTVALEILGSAAHPEAEMLARKFLVESTISSKKLGALEVLGRLGTPATRAWLAALPDQGDPLTAHALQKALRNLMGRHANTPE